jgi:hypothetical protein
MDRNNNLNDNDNYMETQAGSSDRPPQFNEVNCGYRCGEGCCEPQGGDDDGGGGEEGRTDATPTLVSSDDGIEELDEPHPVEDAEEPHIAGTGAHILDGVNSGSTTFLDDLDGSLQSHGHGTAHEHLPSSSTADWVYGDSRSNLPDNFVTISHSSAASDAGSADNMSRSGYFVGIGACFDQNQANPFPGFFCQMPLRLSPRYEDCRGPPIFQDFSTLLGPAGYAWDVPRATIGYAYHRDT